VTTNVTAETAQALWYIAPGRAEIREEILPAPSLGEVRVRALFGALSRGTEALVLAGRVPESEFERMRAPFMVGCFPFPIKYGYSSVGVVEDGPGEHRGRTVFTLHPHQSHFNIPSSAVVPLPETVPPRRAVLAANMETALNAVWDGAASPADRIAIVGAGVVGSLVAFLCARLAGTEVTLIDINERRTELAQKLGIRFATPETAMGDCDLVVHASGSAAGLSTALSLAGEEATVLELSWYGETQVTVPLGGTFHSRRLRLISSQVGRVAASHRPRWAHSRRLEAALGLLADPCLDALLAPDVAFRDLPRRLPDILNSTNGAVCQLISYS